MSRGISKHTRQIVDRARELWETVYRPAGIVPTVRQLFYALAVVGLVLKSEAGYGKVQRTLVRARERGEYPWDGIYDGLRQIQKPNTYHSLSAYLYTVQHAYRLDRWQTQPERLEVWIEKDAVRGTVESVTQEFQVPLLVDRGYLSVTAKYEASQRMVAERAVIIYIGDFDPSGVNMLEEAGAWVKERAGAITIERIAITEEDHADPDLPHLEVNHKDVRTEGFLRRFGDQVVEVEALPPEQLQARLRKAIKGHIDQERWEEAAEREEGEQERLERLIAAFEGSAEGLP